MNPREHSNFPALQWAQQDRTEEVRAICRAAGLTEEATIRLLRGDWQVTVPITSREAHHRQYDALSTAFTAAGWQDMGGGGSAETWEQRWKKSLGEPPRSLAPVDLAAGNQGIVVWANGHFLWSLVINGPDEDGEWSVRTDHAEHSYFSRDGMPTFRGRAQPVEWRLIGFIPCTWGEAEPLMGNLAVKVPTEVPTANGA